MGHDVSRNNGPEISRRLLHKGTRFDFESVTYRTGTGAEISRDVVRHPGAVVILPMLDMPGEARKVVMIRNFRASIGAELWELPAGTREAGEPAAATAGRELIEETGYESATIEELGRFHTTPGLTDELMYAYVATGLRHVGQELEAGELITVHCLPVAEVFAMANRGEICDAKSLLCLFWARERGMI